MQRQAKRQQKSVAKSQSKKTQKVQKVQKRSKTTQAAKKQVQKSSTLFTAPTLSFTAPRSLSKSMTFSQSPMLSLTPKSLQTTPTRSFRSTARLFDPEPTGPAAVDQVSPKVQQIVQDILTLNIMESLQLTKALKKEFGYSDSAFAMAAPVAVAGAAAAAAPAEEEKPKAPAKTNFNVKLESFDAASKVKVIKEVRTISGLGLKEAKELVDGAPSILKKEVKKEDAEAIVKLMKEIGAVCILE